MNMEIQNTNNTEDFSEITDVKKDSGIMKHILYTIMSNVRTNQKTGISSFFGGHGYMRLEDIEDAFTNTVKKFSGVTVYKTSQFIEAETHYKITLKISCSKIINNTLHFYEEQVTSVKQKNNIQDKKSDVGQAMQSYGSVQTYMTRYALRAYILNLFTSEDDPDNTVVKIQNPTNIKNVPKPSIRTVNNSNQTPAPNNSTPISNNSTTTTQKISSEAATTIKEALEGYKKDNDIVNIYSKISVFKPLKLMFVQALNSKQAPAEIIAMKEFASKAIGIHKLGLFDEFISHLKSLVETK